MGLARHLERTTAIAPAAGSPHGTLRVFLQRGTPSCSSRQTWSWLAPRQLFRQGPWMMTAPAPPPGSGTRTSSRRPSPLPRSSLGVQDPPGPSLSPRTMTTMMTSEQLRLGPAGLQVAHSTGLLLYLLPCATLSSCPPRSSPRGLRGLPWRDERELHTLYHPISIKQSLHQPQQQQADGCCL